MYLWIVTIVCIIFNSQIYSWNSPLVSIASSKQKFNLKINRPAILIATASIISLQFSSCLIALADDDNVNVVKKTENVIGMESVDGEVLQIFNKARQFESDGSFKEAQSYYEQVISVEPAFINAWSNLGNVLVAEGNLNQAKLCYLKAISLHPSPSNLASIILNKAAIELSLGNSKVALKELQSAESISGSSPSITINKAVALSNIGEWDQATKLFESVISTSDRYALPWWLRYSMSLMESSRGMESVAFLQRTLNRFPDEPECLAFASALYSSLGSNQEAISYWQKLNDADKQKFALGNFVSDKLHWGPKAVVSFNGFLSRNHLST